MAKIRTASPRTPTLTPTPIRVFISHAHADFRLADAVASLLEAAIGLSADAIRCTSRDGSRLPAGVRIDAQLQREVRHAKVFVGIVSARSVRSSYVLFEMGARWGANKHVLPLLARGEPTSLLPGPMRDLSVLQLASRSELDQFVREVAARLGAGVSLDAEYRRRRRQVVGLRRQRASDPAARCEAKLRALRAENVELMREIEAVHEQSSNLLPSVELLTLECSFDEAGSGEQVRRWSGISAPQSIVNCQIEYEFSVAAPHGRVSAPADLATEIRRPKASRLAVKFKPSKQTTNRVVKGHVQILGLLTPKTGFVGFELRQPFERAFCMTRREMEAAYKNDEWKTEYVGIIIQVPTETLEIAIVFPPSFRDLTPPPMPVVFLESTERVHDEETERAQSTFSFRRNTAKLRVSKPKQGLQYAVYWTPPAGRPTVVN